MIRKLRNFLLFLAAAAGVAYFALNLPKSVGNVQPSSDPHGPGKHEHAGEGVELSDEKLAAAGIELLKAGPGVLRDALALNGILQPNQEALVQATPRFPGVVREIRVLAPVPRAAAAQRCRRRRGSSRSWRRIE